MKKNVMMRVASALLVAVLMTTCAISGTFAKYTTTNSGSDDARVARWGFTENTITVDMFDGSYTNVQSSNTDNVLAPGTSKTATISFLPQGGTPEVAYTFTVTITVTATGANGQALFDKLTWTVGSDVVTFENGVAKTVVNAAEYGVGTNPSDLQVKWEWKDTGDNAGDTAIGNGEANIEVSVSYTATQKTN